MTTQGHISMEFHGTFERHHFRMVTRRLFDSPIPSDLTIDLRDVSYAYATAVVPLIALDKYLRSQGTLVEILYPYDDRYWEISGWKQLLEGEDVVPVDPGKSYIPVQTYSDSSQLNEIVTAVVEVLSRHMVCSDGVLASIEWTLNELADNVLVHAAEPGVAVEGFMQVVSHPEQQKVDLVVSDYGRGIRDSLWQSHPTLNDQDALLKAIQAGVTRDQSAGQGNGLAGSVRIASSAGGLLTIMSGNAELDVVDGNPGTTFSGAVPGTTVCLVLSTDAEINITEALWGKPPMSAFEMTHITEDDTVAFRVVEEASGFGNRDTGRQLRTKLQNIMTQFPNSRVEIDFADVALVSASFADEFVAKLVVELGHFSFFNRMAVTNANQFIGQTLDNVIRQRSEFERAT